MSLQSLKTHAKLKTMNIKTLFKSIALNSLLDGNLKVTIDKGQPNGKCSVTIDGLGSLQGYSLTRYINSEYNVEARRPINYNIGDPTINGIASVVDDEYEAVTVVIDQSELSKFREFLVSRRDDIEFLFEHSEITNLLRTRRWQEAKQFFQLEIG